MGAIAAQRYQTFRDTRVFGSLNGCRALSVIAVIWFHTAGGVAGFRQGALGVEFFFAISGFLITTLLLREWSERGRIDLRGFYVRRVLRIFPLYYLVLVIYVLLVVTTRSTAADGQEFMANLPYFATYTSNWFVDLHSGPNVIFFFSWSLATEEQYYLVWPLLLVLSLQRARAIRLASVLITTIALVHVVVALIWAQRSAFPVEIVKSVSTPICVGSLMALVLHSRRGFQRVVPVLGRAITVPVLAAGLGLAIALEANREVIGAVMALLVAAVCIRENHLLAVPLNWRPLSYIGTISYGMYLMHMLAANVVRVLLQSRYGIWVFVATLGLVIISASLSYRCFEKPIQDLRYRFRADRRAPSGPSSASALQHADVRSSLTWRRRLAEFVRR